MFKIYKNIGFISILFPILFSCKNTDKRTDYEVKNMAYKFNEVRKGLISFNTVDDSIFIIDSIGNKFFLTLDNYSSKLNYVPIIAEENCIIIQLEENKKKYLTKYNYKKNIQLYKSEINEELISHCYLNDTIVVLGFNSGKYKIFNLRKNILDDLYDFSRSTTVYHSSKILQSYNNDIYVLIPKLDCRSIVKINILSKKILWESNINHDFVNFKIIKNQLFYLATDDFHKGEIGIINTITGKVIYKRKTFPNVLTNPISVADNYIYYGNSEGKIMRFSLSNFTEKKIYSSSEESRFLGLGSSNLYCLNNYIYFVDNFKIYRINIKTNKTEFVKNHDFVGFNFLIYDKAGKLEVY